MLCQSEKLAAEISHGERRLLELALAMATNPILLLLDEPMAGAGIEESRHIASIIEAQKSNHAILLIEHDMNAVFQLADRITVLVEGEAIASGTPDEISNNTWCATPILATEKSMLILDKVNAGYGTAQVLFDLSLQLMLVNVSSWGETVWERQQL